MPLFVSTVSTSVVVSELGITLTHPTVNFQVDAQFTAEQIQQAQTLTTAIQNGQLTWKKTSTGSNEPATSYDPEHIELEQERVGGQSSFGSYHQRQKNLTEMSNSSTDTWMTHTTLTTPSLPLGDYAVITRYRHRVSANNRSMSVRIVCGGVLELSDSTNFPNSGEQKLVTHYGELENISGVQNIQVQFVAGASGLLSGTTAYLSEVHIAIWRIK